MDADKYLSFIVDEVHSVIVATVDDEGKPVTAAMDMMEWDEGGVYFLTARGKNFYDRLTKRGCLSLTAMKGESTLECIACSLQGDVAELGHELVEQLCANHPYMYQIYPTEASRSSLTVFKVYRGSGEYFDLTSRPVNRESFSFGGESVEERGYRITDECIGCGVCESYCPQECIVVEEGVSARIEPEHCERCGNCFDVCPMDAVERLG